MRNVTIKIQAPANFQSSIMRVSPVSQIILFLRLTPITYYEKSSFSAAFYCRFCFKSSKKPDKIWGYTNGRHHHENLYFGFVRLGRDPRRLW